MKLIKKALRFIVGFMGAFAVLFGVTIISDAKTEGDNSLYFLGGFFMLTAALCFYFAFKDKFHRGKSKNESHQVIQQETSVSPQQEVVTNPVETKSNPITQSNSSSPTETANQPVFDTAQLKPKKPSGCGKPLIVFVVIFVVLAAIVGNIIDSTPSINNNVKMLMDESGFNQEVCEKVYAQLQECGLEDISTIITIVESDGTWYSCRVTSNKYYGSGVVNIIPEEGLYTFNWGGVTIYNPETLKEPRHLDDYTLPYGADVTYMSQVEELIKGYLKSPSTAKFPGRILETDQWSFEYSYEKGLITISSYVDAQNSFGAMIRSPFTVKIDVEKNAVIYVNLDGQIYK